MVSEENPNASKDDLIGDTKTVWLGNDTCIELVCFEGSKIMLRYNDLKTEYGQYLLSVDK